MRMFVILGSFNMLLAVALGAFGAHGLKSRVSAEMLAVWQTAVLYHLVHGLGLLLVGLLALHLPVRMAGWTLQGGIVLFSGSLYLMVLTGIRPLGMVTPLGGVAFLAGWLLLALAALKFTG
jgi:uncharacterized membrane protein YgdD (TMEM256/DUF423 family)